MCFGRGVPGLVRLEELQKHSSACAFGHQGGEKFAEILGLLRRSAPRKIKGNRIQSFNVPPSMSQQASKSPGSRLTVTKLPSRYTLLRPALFKNNQPYNNVVLSTASSLVGHDL